MSVLNNSPENNSVFLPILSVSIRTTSQYPLSYHLKPLLDKRGYGKYNEIIFDPYSMQKIDFTSIQTKFPKMKSDVFFIQFIYKKFYLKNA